MLILDRGRAVATLDQPRFRTETEQEARIADLERRGILIPPKAQLPPDFFTKPLPKAPGGVSIVDLLIREREEGW